MTTASDILEDIINRCNKLCNKEIKAIRRSKLIAQGSKRKEAKNRGNK